MNNDFTNIDEYISLFSGEIQTKLNEIREIIKNAAPESKEIISYKMPAYKQKGILVYFAANKNHIGFYPTPSGVEVFKDELSEYKCSKAAIQFPLNKPLPKELITKIVKFRIEEDLQKYKFKK